MKKLILVLALIFCLIFSFNTLAFEKVDVTMVNCGTAVQYVLKIQTLIDHGLGTSTTVVAYEEGDPILQVWGTCDSVDGGTIATPVYIHSILTEIGAVGRAAEFVLAPTARMGGYGNAVKALLDVSGTDGSIGLLAGLCAEVVTPATALSGTLACVEHEIVATEGFTAGAHIGSANTINFMQFALSGHGAAVTQVDNRGQFMIINGLTPLAGNMLSADYVTLKLGVNNLAKYLVMSVAENMISIGNSTANPDIADGSAALLQVEATMTGTSTGMFSASSSWANVNGATGANWVNAITTGVWENAGSSGDVSNGTIIFGVRMQAILTNSPDRLCPFALNSIIPVTALFSVGNTNVGGDCGYVEAITESDTPIGYVPLLVDSGGTVHWVRVYADQD